MIVLHSLKNGQNFKRQNYFHFYAAKMLLSNFARLIIQCMSINTCESNKNNFKVTFFTIPYCRKIWTFDKYYSAVI